MSKPSNFDQAAYQFLIDGIVGCMDGRSIIKLVWPPETCRWMPHKLGTDPIGYKFPVFCNNRVNGKYYGPERWALMDRLEWGQYAPTWEHARYKKHKGNVWDLKGPCPDEYYAELKCYTSHNGKCCDCIGEICKCEIHCWGVYMEPDSHLLDWIRRTTWESRHDSDVDPFADVRFFEAPQAQRDHVNAAQQAADKNAIETEVFDKEARELFIRAPHSISGLNELNQGYTYPIKEIMSTEISAGFPTDGRMFEPPQANRDNEQPRYLSFIGSLIDPEIVRSRPWTKGGGIEVANPCLRYVKNFIRKGRITPLLRDTHDFQPYDYIKKMMDGNPLSGGWFSQPIPQGYVPPALPAAAGDHQHGFGNLLVGGPSPYGSLIGRLALPGEQIDSILTGEANLTQTNIQRGVVEHKSLIGHPYRPVQVGEVFVDPEIWQIQQSIFPDYPSMPTLLDEIEQLLEAATVHTSLRAVTDEMLESLTQFRDYAEAAIQNVHHNIRESAGRRGYVYRYTSMDLVLLEQLGKNREDRELRQAAKGGDDDMKELLRKQSEVQAAWMQAQIEEKQALTELHKRQAALLDGPTINGHSMQASGPLEGQDGYPGQSGYSGYSGEVVAQTAPEVKMFTCEHCGQEMKVTAKGIHLSRWCSVLYPKKVEEEAPKE